MPAGHAGTKHPREPLSEVIPAVLSGRLRVSSGVDPQAWLADVLARIADHKITDLAALLPLDLTSSDCRSVAA
jgi:hypothetical protein